MNPNEYNNSAKTKSRSLGYIVAAVAALLLIIFAFFARDNSGGEKKSELTLLSNKLSEEKLVLNTDMLLHTGFSKLQKLDEEYTLQLFNGASANSIDSTNKLITQAETELGRTIDSVKKEIPKFNSWSNVTMLDSITSTFRMALSNRKYISDIRGAMSGRSIDISPDQKQMMQLKRDLEFKEQRIATLEKQKTIKPTTTTTTNSSPQVQKELKAMESLLKEEETRNTALLDLTKNLKEENEKLSTEIRQAKKSGGTETDALAAAKSRMQVLQEELDELGAELNFARIDCSLSRVDTKKIISNSRQRKELLSETLQSLQTLSKSDNSSVQRRAKEKISKLNEIASTVRD